MLRTFRAAHFWFYRAGVLRLPNTIGSYIITDKQITLKS